MVQQMERKRKKVKKEDSIVDQLMQGSEANHQEQLMPTSESKILKHDTSATLDNAKSASAKTLVNDLMKQHKSKQQLSEMIKAKNEKIAKEIKVEGFQNHLFHNSDLTHSLPFGIHDPSFKYSFLQ